MSEARRPFEEATRSTLADIARIRRAAEDGDAAKSATEQATRDTGTRDDAPGNNAARATTTAVVHAPPSVANVLHQTEQPRQEHAPGGGYRPAAPQAFRPPASGAALAQAVAAAHSSNLLVQRQQQAGALAAWPQQSASASSANVLQHAQHLMKHQAALQMQVSRSVQQQVGKQQVIEHSGAVQHTPQHAVEPTAQRQAHTQQQQQQQQHTVHTHLHQVQSEPHAQIQGDVAQRNSVEMGVIKNEQPPLQQSSMHTPYAHTHPTPATPPLLQSQPPGSGGQAHQVNQTPTNDRPGNTVDI